jgi:apolipoprotein N-acyltransferase
LILIVVTNTPILKSSSPTSPSRSLSVAGIQMEFPAEVSVPAALDKLANTYPEADLLVLSEYTFDGPVPERVKDWCKANQKYLVVGGKDPLSDGNYFNTAFVIGPNGEIAFQQTKSVPIQFFKDGLPATEQQLWDSPWGKIGLCICYDLSYRRVVDELVRQGAEALIVPMMDVADWGKHQHELHSRVPPVRAAEYGIPIFRVASSGISQLVNAQGQVEASAPFPGEEAMLGGKKDLRNHGGRPLDSWLAPLSSILTALVVLSIGFASLKSRKQTTP